MAHEDIVTGLDILHGVLLDAGQRASSSDSYFSEAKRYVRKAYWRFLGLERWPWALSPTPGVITTVAKVEATVQSISGATVTLSASLSPSMAGRKFYLESTQSVYRILTHTSGTATLGLDATYVETETAGATVIFQDEYQMPKTVLKVWDPLNVRGQRYDEIRLWDKPRFEHTYGRGTWSLGFGPLEAACEVAPDPYDAVAKGLVRKLRFAPWSEEALNIEFDFALFHDLDFTGTASDVDTPHCPREHRSVLVDLAVFEMFVLKDETKADQAILKANMQLGEMREQYLPPQFGSLHARQKHSATLGLN